MGSMAARALSTGKGLVLTEEALFRLGLLMTGEAENGLFLAQQFISF